MNEVEKRRAKRKRKKQRIRLFLQEYLSFHPCVNCGTSNNLSFHHRNPELKLMTVSRLVQYKSMLLIQKEIDKCDVLCRDCHDVQHGMVRKEKEHV